MKPKIEEAEAFDVYVERYILATLGGSAGPIWNGSEGRVRHIRRELAAAIGDLLRDAYAEVASLRQERDEALQLLKDADTIIIPEPRN